MKHAISIRLLVASLVLISSGLACGIPGTAGSTGGGDSVTAIPLGGTSSPVGACANPLLPVASTALWNYHASGTPAGDFDFFMIITGVDSTGFDEATHIGSVASTVHWNCTPAGLLVLQPGGGLSSTVVSPRTSSEDTTTGSSGVTLPGRINTGDAWTDSLTLHGETSSSSGTVGSSDGTYIDHFTAAGVESVTVPAGTFNAMRIDIESNWDLTTTVAGASVPIHLNLSASAWYAPGVGLVRMVTLVGDVTSTVELTSYTLP